jgi:hypothetical protein
MCRGKCESTHSSRFGILNSERVGRLEVAHIASRACVCGQHHVDASCARVSRILIRLLFVGPTSSCGARLDEAG